MFGYKPVSIADPAALGFIISPWSLLLLPSGNVSFTDENISNKDLRAFTAPEVLQNQSLTSLSDVEKVTVKVFFFGLILFGLPYLNPLKKNIKMIVCFKKFIFILIIQNCFIKFYGTKKNMKKCEPLLTDVYKDVFNTCCV